MFERHIKKLRSSIHIDAVNLDQISLKLNLHIQSIARKSVKFRLLLQVFLSLIQKNQSFCEEFCVSQSSLLANLHIYSRFPPFQIRPSLKSFLCLLDAQPVR